MLRPRLNLRTGLILMALVALAIGGEQMRRRREYCLHKSFEHRTRLLTWSNHIPQGLISPGEEDQLRGTDPHAAWHLRVSDAYLRCASHPWEAVPVEPPEPPSFAGP